MQQDWQQMDNLTAKSICMGIDAVAYLNSPCDRFLNSFLISSQNSIRYPSSRSISLIQGYP
jgi:hypothetical protein